MTTIEIKEITKVIHGNIVLEEISGIMQSGVIYGIQGINGSGKTMLMRILLGFIRPTKGVVKINRKQLGKDLEFADSLGFLLETPTFLERYSGYENLKMLASIRNLIGDEEIYTILRKVGLDEEAGKKKYRKYSLGMKQRLGIAAAIMEKPDIVILDEPTNALDSDGVDMVKKLILEEKKRGALVVISCHDMTILEYLSDEIWKLENGRLVERVV